MDIWNVLWDQGFKLFFQFCKMGRLAKFSQKIVKLVDSTLDKQNFPHFPTYFGRKMTPICQNKQTLVGTWDQSSTYRFDLQIP